MRSPLVEARRGAGSAVMRAFFSGSARLAQLHPQSRPERHGAEVLRDLPYRDTRRTDHLLDIYRPLCDTPLVGRRYDGPPWPVVFYAHGGAFRILSKDTHWVMALGFARRGFLVVNVNYRLAPRHRFPAAIEDVCDAFRWTLENVARYGGDPERIVLAGESAGANLAASLAVALAYERPEPFARAVFETGAAPRAVLPACGVFQVSDIARIRRRKPGMSAFIAERLAEVEYGYLGKGPHDGSLDLADPVCLFERGERPARPLPPFFLPVGTKDPLLDDNRRMAAALRKLGVEAEDRYYPGEYHAFHAFPMLPNARRCWADTYAFLDKHVPS